MKPVRKKIPTQIVPLVTVSRNACSSPEAVSCTAPICDIPRFSIKSPALAHTTISKTMIRALIRSLFSLAIFRMLVVSGSGGRSRHGNHGFGEIVAALTSPLQALRAQLQEFRGFCVEALAFVAVPQRFLYDAPRDPRSEIIFVVKAIHAGHHFRL